MMGAQNEKAFQQHLSPENKAEQIEKVSSHLTIVKENDQKPLTIVSNTDRNFSTRLKDDISIKKIFTPAVIILLAALSFATIASLGNPVFFEQLLICNLIIMAVIFLKNSAPNSSK